MNDRWPLPIDIIYIKYGCCKELENFKAICDDHLDVIHFSNNINIDDHPRIAIQYCKAKDSFEVIKAKPIYKARYGFKIIALMIDLTYIIEHFEEIFINRDAIFIINIVKNKKLSKRITKCHDMNNNPNNG